MNVPFWVWCAFILFVLAMLALDLFVFNRKKHIIQVREALLLSLFWVSLAVAFNIGIYFFHDRGKQAALEFLSGYLIEESLSVDNLFVFLMLFSYFRVPRQYQHRVLFWGILGAVIMRGLFIFLGIELIRHFHWIIYIFGVILIVTALRMLTHDDKEVDPEKNFAVRLLRRFVPVSPRYDGGKFFTLQNGRRVATPLLVVVVAVEATDLIFAVDSIPAILGITEDPFIVFTSNVFAILGLRSIFFALSGVMGLFRHLDKGLCLILLFVGTKMLISPHYVKISIEQSLAAIVGILVLAIAASLIHEKIAPAPRKEFPEEAEGSAPGFEEAEK